MPDGKRLVIPCIELIRFYFGSSGSLVTKLFSPPLTRDSLYSSAAYEKRSGRLSIALAERIPGTSAADIARLHLDNVAWRTALHVGVSSQKLSATGQRYPQAFFPFEGTSTLVVSGKWLSFGDRENGTFVVFSLRSCSHPFPFKSVSYKLARTQQLPGYGEATDKRGTSHQSGGARDPTKPTLVEREPSRSLSPRTTNIFIAPRFPDLLNKSIFNNKLLADAASKAGSKSSAKVVDQLAVGAQASEQRIRSLELAAAYSAAAAKSAEPSFLTETLAELRNTEGITLELLTASQEDGWTVPLHPLSDENGEIDARLMVEDAWGILNLRRAAFFMIQKRSDRFIGAVVENQPIYSAVYFSRDNKPEFTPELIGQLTKEFIKSNGRSHHSLKYIVERI